MYPLAQRDVAEIVNGQFTEVVGEQSSLLTNYSHSSIDFTPAQYISLLFTDLGVLTPAAVSDELIKLYQ